MAVAADSDVRPSAGIAAIGILEVIGYVLTDYSSAGYGALLPWIVVDVLTLRGLWRGRRWAWYLLLILDLSVLTLLSMAAAGAIKTGQSGRWQVEYTLVSFLECAILLSRRVREWAGGAERDDVVDCDDLLEQNVNDE